MYRKVIRASAGTGKTYRLSLEFISLLLANRELKFDEILVITFTKKATAEIRQKLLEHLSEMTEDEHSDLWKNLKSISDKMEFAKDIPFLKKIYREIVLHKHKLQISTIDSFVNSIFSNIVAPYLRFSEYTIDATINDSYLEEIYETIFQQENLPYVKDLFSEKSYKNVTKYEDFIKHIINKRWLFDTSCPDYPQEYIQQNKDKYFTHFVGIFQDILSTFFSYLSEYISIKNFQDDWQKLFVKDFVEIMNNYHLFSADNLSQLEHNFNVLFTERKQLELILETYSKELLKLTNFWNGSKLFRTKNDKELKEELLANFQIAQEQLAEYLFWDKVIPEQEKIYHLARIILHKYDEIKARDKIFTYDDISYFTYRLLYDEKLSIIDDAQVLNVFYEKLSAKFRFILIDEFQDTSLLQWKIVYPIIQELISGSGQADYGGVCVVGDEKQSIYGWRGGKRELLLQAPDFLNCRDVEMKLSTSYRSKENIVAFINNFFGNSFFHNELNSQNIFWKYDQLEPKSEKGFVKLLPINRHESEQTVEEQISDLVLQTIKPLLENNQILAGNTAILARKNKELNLFALAFRQENIPYVQESSLSIFRQRAIAPLFFLLKFFAYHDLVELIKWFRSDIIRLSAKKLKQMMKQISESENDLETFFCELKNNPDWKNLAELFFIAQTNSVRNLILTCIQRFQITQLFDTETDLKNIHRFFEIVGEFEQNQTEHATHLDGFIEFCTALEKKEEYTQLSQTDSDSIQLMTFHKSKGLQFENVFVFVDLSSRKRPNEFHFYEEWDKDFTTITNIALTYNYPEIVKKCSQKYLIENYQKQEHLEEINNLYVAFTRAKSNLWVIASYDSKKDYQAFLSDDKKKFSISNLLFLAFSKQQSGNIHFQQGTLWKNEIPEKEKDSLQSFPTDFLEIAESRLPQKLDEFISKEHKDKFQIRHQQVKGIIAHHYLSYIIYDDEVHRKSAYEQTIGKYGTLLTMTEIESIIQSIHSFLVQNSLYFRKDKWDVIQTEYSVQLEEKLYRIDRLVIDNKKKQILILDFKIGEHYEQKQLDTYEKALGKLPFIKENGYRISSRFLEINL